MKTETGRCLCGSVRITAELDNNQFHVCHCAMCMRWSGGPVFATGARHVTFTGEENIVVFQSSEWAERGFCKSCGSWLFYRLRETGKYYLAAGNLDNFGDMTMSSELFIEHQSGNYSFGGNHAKLTEADIVASYRSEIEP